MKVIKFVLYYILGLIGILLISTAPALFGKGAFFDLSSYVSALGQLFMKIIQPSEWMYLFKGNPVPLLEYLWEPYRYSMTVFFGGILLAAITAFLFAFATMFLPKWAKMTVERILNVLEAVPDLLLAFSLQLFIVWFFQQTNILLFDFAAVGQDKIYLLPILAISVLPMIMLYKIILMLMDEEMTKSYVQMAKSKGLKKGAILNVHILRNIVKSVFYHSKIIIWSSLSSLLIFEYIFNMNGITTTFMGDFRPIVSAVILFMLFTPFFVIYQGAEMFLFKAPVIAKEANLKMNRFVGKVSVRKNGKSFKQMLAELGAHFKNVKFLLGFLIISTMLMISVIYTMTADPLIEQFNLVYNEAGKLVSAPPHEPKYVFLGTDVLGFSIFDQLLAGAKYTILFALIIAFLRMAIGFVLAIPFTFFLSPKLQKGLEKLIDGMHFLPLTIIAYILLLPVLMMPPGGFVTTEFERILYQGVILTLLVLPLVVTLFGNEMKLLMKEEYVMSTKVMGGSSLHLLWKHFMPHLSVRMGIVFGQQFIQTLLILIHLGVFDIYFGGTKKSYSPLFADPPTSTTYEWSGLIGASKDALMTGRWWYIVPALVCFMVLIVSMQLIIQGIKEVQQKRVGVPIEQFTWWRTLMSKRKAEKAVNEAAPDPESFVFTHMETEERAAFRSENRARE